MRNLKVEKVQNVINKHSFYLYEIIENHKFINDEYKKILDFPMTNNSLKFLDDLKKSIYIPDNVGWFKLLGYRNIKFNLMDKYKISFVFILKGEIFNEESINDLEIYNQKYGHDFPSINLKIE